MDLRPFPLLQVTCSWVCTQLRITYLPQVILSKIAEALNDTPAFLSDSISRGRALVRKVSIVMLSGHLECTVGLTACIPD
jgi:hypothetical protein